MIPTPLAPGSTANRILERGPGQLFAREPWHYLEDPAALAAPVFAVGPLGFAFLRAAPPPLSTRRPGLAPGPVHPGPAQEPEGRR